MSDEQLDEMGPIDCVLVDRGLIRILDLAFILKEEDGSGGRTARLLRAVAG